MTSTHIFIFIILFILFAAVLTLWYIYKSSLIRRSKITQLKRVRNQYTRASEKWLNLLLEERDRMQKSINILTKERDDIQKRLELLLIAQSKIDSYNEKKASEK